MRLSALDTFLRRDEVIDGGKDDVQADERGVSVRPEASSQLLRGVDVVAEVAQRVPELLDVER